MRAQAPPDWIASESGTAVADDSGGKLVVDGVAFEAHADNMIVAVRRVVSEREFRIGDAVDFVVVPF